MRIWAPISLISATLLGCGAQAPEPLAPKDFYAPSPQQAVGEAPRSRTDMPGQLAPKEPHSQPMDLPAADVPAINGIPRSVQNVILPPGADLATTQPTTVPSVIATTERSPTTQMATDTWITMGSLVAEVNGVPIYANKVLRLDARILREKARQYDLERFQISVRQTIEQTVNELVHNELEYAAAEKTLATQDKQLADFLTQKWRENQISESGGSVELARRKSLAAGKDFGEAVADQHRTYMVQLYYTRKVNPQVQVSRTDIYRYYIDHLDSEYTTHDSAVVDIVRGSEDSLQEFRKAILSGSDWTELAASFKDKDKITMSNQSFSLQRGSFVMKKVEAAIWNLQVGQISQPIEDRGGFYLVKVDSRVAGSVQSFDNEEVQEKIKLALQNQQLRRLRDVEQRKLMEGAIIRSDESMIDACVEMAMENYTQWRNGK